MELSDKLLKKQEKLHFSLIDPDRQKPEDAGRRAEICKSYGTDAIMVGGSTVKDRKSVYDTVHIIKRDTNLPVILFPNSAEAVTGNADYVFFMSLLNSRNDRFLIREQVKGAPLVKKWGIKPISMAYVVISTSENPTMVEKVANLDRIGENDIGKAVDYALAAEYFGMNCIYLEAGSGAEKPVPNEMVRAVRNAISIPIIVGGGIKNGDIAKEKVDSGADVIVNGTATEENVEVIREIITKIKNFNAARRHDIKI